MHIVFIWPAYKLRRHLRAMALAERTRFIAWREALATLDALAHDSEVGTPD